MKKLNWENELTLSFFMFDVVCDLNPSRMMKKRVDLNLKWDFGVLEGFGVFGGVWTW
jgi:hypothetical protein